MNPFNSSKIIFFFCIFISVSIGLLTPVKANLPGVFKVTYNPPGTKITMYPSERKSFQITIKNIKTQPVYIRNFTYEQIPVFEQFVCLSNPGIYVSITIPLDPGAQLEIYCSATTKATINPSTVTVRIGFLFRLEEFNSLSEYSHAENVQFILANRPTATPTKKPTQTPAPVITSTPTNSPTVTEGEQNVSPTPSDEVNITAETTATNEPTHQPTSKNAQNTSYYLICCITFVVIVVISTIVGLIYVKRRKKQKASK